MERSSSITQRLPRSSRLLALARRSASAAEGACSTAGGHLEATVQLARRVARNPFVPWKAWRKEKYGYAAVPTAALPPPSDIHTSLRSIKAHRNPVQQVPRNRIKQCSRKGRRNNVRRGPEVESWGISTSPFTSYSKAAVSPENSACSPPSTSTLSVFSSRPSSPVSAAAAAPLSPLSSRSFSLSTFSACSRSAVASRPDAPCVPRRQQQEQKRVQGQHARGKYHQSSSCEVGNTPWHHAPCVPAARRGARNTWRSSLSAVLETGRRRWMFTDQGQHRQHKRVTGDCCESLQQAEQSYYRPAAALHCRAAFPPPCSCACFRQASAASLQSHTEKLEARRLAFSASPDPCTRSAAAGLPDSATEASAAAQKCVKAAAVCSPAYATAQSGISSTKVSQRAGGEDLTGDGARENRSSFPVTMTSPAVFAASGSAAQTPGVHSASGASGAGLLLPVIACTGTDTCACLTKATSVSEKPHLRRSEYDAWGSSNSSYPSPRGFFITLHSFKCRARRFCDTPTPSKSTAAGVEVDGIGSRTALVVPGAEGHQAAVGLALTRAADPSAILLSRTLGPSQMATGVALEAPVSTMRATSWSAQTNFTPTSETSAPAAAGAASTQVVICGAMERSAYAEATARATALAHSAATTPPLAPLTSGTSGLSCIYTAASITASQLGDQCSEDGAAVRGENGAAVRAPAACAGGGGEALSTCSRTCGRRCASPGSRAPGNTLKSSGAASAAEAHETNGRLLPVQAGGEVPEAAACAAVGAAYRHAPLSSSYELDAVQEREEHSQYQHSCGSLLPYEDVRCTTEEQRGEQLQLQQKQLHGAQPGGHCKAGRQYEFCGSSMRRLHTESEGETDDSENGVNCRQKEELRWNCKKLTKSSIQASLHCTLSR